MLSGGGGGGSLACGVLIVVKNTVMGSPGDVVQGLVVCGGGVDHWFVVSGGGIVPDVMVCGGKDAPRVVIGGGGVVPGVMLFSRVVDSVLVVSVVDLFAVLCVEGVDPGLV